LNLSEKSRNEANSQRRWPYFISLQFFDCLSHLVRFMKFRSFFPLAAGVLSFGATFFLSERAPAAPEVFTIDSSQSQTILSGNIAGFAITPQGAGSLITTYSGSINADVSGSTIHFTGSSMIIAKTNGVWQPGVGGASGSAAADYGAQASIEGFFTADGAARNVVLDLTSPLLTVTGTNFDSSALLFSFATGSNSSFDYRVSGISESGSLSLAGNSTNTVANGASLTTAGTTQKLVIQFNTPFTFSLLSPNDTTLVLTGQIVATNSAVVPFMISSIVLSNQSVVLNVENATMQSQLQSSTNLTTWSSASGTVSSNAGITTFITPMTGKQGFFRVQK
jgi:hypothetical protein